MASHRGTWLLRHVLLALLQTQLLARSPPYDAPPRVRSCLEGAHVFASGPSELAILLAWLTGGTSISTRRNTASMNELERTQTVEINHMGAHRTLTCSTRRNLGDRRFSCLGGYRYRALCREEMFARLPFEANCTGTRGSSWRGTSFQLTYQWKSFQISRADAMLRASVASAIARGHARRVIVVLSAGMQHWSRFIEHREALLHNVRDDEPWPQVWFDNWINSTMRLFSLFSPTSFLNATKASPSICVVWRAQNVAPRHANHSNIWHHPSAMNGVHHYLNRIGIGMARLWGIHPLDLTNYTLSMPPLDHPINQDGSGRADRVSAGDGDVYHGYQPARLAPRFLESLANACCASSND